MAIQSETKSHISHYVIAKSHIIHIGTHEYHPVSSSLTHKPFAQLDLLLTSHTNMSMTELYKSLIVMHVL